MRNDAIINQQSFSSAGKPRIEQSRSIMILGYAICNSSHDAVTSYRRPRIPSFRSTMSKNTNRHYDSNPNQPIKSVHALIEGQTRNNKQYRLFSSTATMCRQQPKLKRRVDIGRPRIIVQFNRYNLWNSPFSRCFKADCANFYSLTLFRSLSFSNTGQKPNERVIKLAKPHSDSHLCFLPRMSNLLELTHSWLDSVS